MQQLETSKQIVEAEQIYKRMGKGRAIAQSRRIYRLLQTDVFYVESESTDNVYYFVKFKPDVVEYCTCPDNSLRGSQMKCKHLHSIEFAIRMGTLRDIDRLPTEAKVKKVIPAATTPTKVASSYKEDEYSF
jgi:predicted nucleic acid-binding Zn finger protein